MTNSVKYIVRAVKYFFYFTFLMIIIMCVLVLAHVVEGNIETMFRDGYKSLWQIAGMFACVAAIYPIFGFVKKMALIPEDRGDKLETEHDGRMTFRNRSIVNRISRMCEDRITLTPTLGGFEVEGLRKDTIRIIYGLENAFRHKTEDDNQ